MSAIRSSVGRGSRWTSAAMAIALAGTSMAVMPAVALAESLPDPPPLEPIDEQVVTQAADQTWADYKPIPNSPYADPSITPSVERWNVALILTDFPDTPFVVTQPVGSTVFNQPGPLAHDLARAAVPAFYKEWLNTPSAMNELQGMNRYWMEDTYGRYGVALEGYGPYLLPGDQNEYFINDITGSTNLTCAVQTRTTTAQLAVTDVQVVSSASFSVGKIVRGLVTGSTTTHNRVVTEIPNATTLRTGAASTMAAASSAGATNIKYANTAGLQGLSAGHELHIGFDDRLEIRTIVSVGTSGSGGGGITLDAPLAFAHATNTILRDMTTSPIASVPSNSFSHTCNRAYRTDVLVAWADHVSLAERNSYDNTFYVAAGQDESGTWQEFGEMQFLQNTVPDHLGPPNPEIGRNWAETRYIPWTSWRSAATVWPNASGTNSLEGEGSGMAVYAHELTHNLGIADNYNNPYAAPFQRAATGYWSMMSRGSFGGPGGTHNRYHIPSTLGTALGSQHVLRDKIKLGFVPPANFLDLNRNGLATSGIVVADVKAREVDPGATGQTGIRINLDGAAPADKNLSCTVFTTTLAAAAPAGATNIKVASVGSIQVGRQLTVGTPANGELRTITAVGTAGAGGTGVTLNAPLQSAHAAGEDVSNRLNCSGTANFNNYTIEVVDQMGSDSFQPTHGVLLEKNKTSEGSSCGSFTCFAWIIDAHPEDINMVDFVRPDGTTQYVTTGDPRQLTDATFHAGLNSGSLYEWEETLNGLRFYVIDKHVNEDGELSYTVAVQNINGSGPQTRGVDLADATPQNPVDERYATCDFELTNTGAAAPVGSPHPENVSAYLNNDVYRLSVSSDGDGWQAQLSNALATAAFGDSVSVPVYVTRDNDSARYATVTLTATSVSDAAATATATCSLDLVAPQTTAALSPDAVNGWYSDPTVTLTASDAEGVGVDFTEFALDGGAWTLYTAPFQVTGDGSRTLDFRSTDLAGNVEATQTLNFDNDGTPPTIDLVVPAEAVTAAAGAAGNYPLGSTVNASYTCDDNLSGVAGCVGTVANGSPIDTSTVGYHSFAVDATDVAGNTTNASRQYNVYWADMTGFLAPIGPGTNAANAGGTVPVRFSLGADYGLAVFAAGYPASQEVDCGTLAPIGSLQPTTAGSGGLFIEDGKYVYEWKTNKNWKNTCRQLVIVLADNSTHTALFNFTK